MFGSRLTKKEWLYLLSGLIIAAVGVVLSVLMRASVKRDCYDEQIEAAELMQKCMDAVKQEKLSRGIAISDEDRFDTGLIGEDYNFITTTQGDIAAKRTTTDPNMAAVMAAMLEDAGLEKGDTLGCNFSGSFPAMNIATLCACEVLGIEPVYICSCGASCWGANNPELTFPEMADLLYTSGLITTAPAMITPGGGDDVGGGIDSEMFSDIWDRVSSLPYPIMAEADYEKNIGLRKALFDSEDIDCFISVGGNITSLGYNMIAGVIGQGILTEEIRSVNSKSGLIEIYLREEVPTILILNIRQLAADCGFAFDPDSRTPIGSGAIYFKNSYPIFVILPTVLAELAVLFLYRKEKKSNEKRHHIYR